MTKFRTACQDYQAGKIAVKCLSQGHHKMARVDFEPRPSLSQSRPFNHSTTLLTKKCFVYEKLAKFLICFNIKIAKSIY